MTNEEYGRRWAQKNNVQQPRKYASAKWLWHNDTGNDTVNSHPNLHESLYLLLDQDFYPDESAAYADLGRAVREIHREIPALPE